jgi:hypothetical protein
LLAEAARREIPKVEQTTRLLTTSLATPTVEIDGNFFTEKNFAYVDDGWFDLFQYNFY